jgi:hypothetical protein
MLSRRTLAAIAYFAGSALSGAAPSEVEKVFKDFVAKFQRKYATPEEETKRFRIFEFNFNFINSENAKGRSYFLVINDFADQSIEEFNSTRFGLSPPSTGKLWAGSPRLGVDEYSGKDLPEEWDWSTKGAVTPVKNQGSCGSCWSFSTTGALEGAWQIKTGQLVSLSEQQLIDCDKSDSACKGGAMDTAFDFLKDHDSCTEESYPYETKANDKCGTTCTVGVPQGSIKGHWDVPTETSALMEAVAQQPVSVGIEADQTTFQSYGGGVLSKACGSKLDHGVLIVGYGTDKGVDYWKVKNSWGPNWGEGGYVRIERGLPGDGECGIKKMASYPEVISSGPVPSPVPDPAPTPAPTPSPGPAPTPSPTCKDSEHFCQDSAVFQPATDCQLLAIACKKTCGCCTDSPKAWCNGAVTKDLTIVV